MRDGLKSSFECFESHYPRSRLPGIVLDRHRLVGAHLARAVRLGCYSWKRWRVSR